MFTTTECDDEMLEALARLSSPLRNRYFRGKELDALHLQLEQDYFVRQRRLLSRLGLGHGVLCGLDVVVARDRRSVRVGPGVAVDGLGREIVVPSLSAAIDPRQLTGDCGEPEGAPLAKAATVVLEICYHECGAEALSAPAADGCDGETRCEHGLVRERYRLGIRRPDHAADHGLLTAEQCKEIFAKPPKGTTRRQVLCKTLDPSCGPRGGACVPLAILKLDAQGRVVGWDACAPRTRLLSNQMLLDLILCLAERVDECCGHLQVKSLRASGGDGQTAEAGTQVPEPLVALVVQAGVPVANEKVTFEVTRGDGAIGDAPGALVHSFPVQTDAHGFAKLKIWQLGPEPGDQAVTARIDEGMPAQVTFHATATPVTTRLPVVRVLWPDNGRRLDPRDTNPVVVQWWHSWRKDPRIEVTFNHPMSPAALDAPNKWVRAFVVRSLGTNEIRVFPVELLHAALAAPMLPDVPEKGHPHRFRIRADDPKVLGTYHGTKPHEVRVMVLMRAEGGNIVDTALPPKALDAEFTGFKTSTIGEPVLEKIWNLPQPADFQQSVWDALAAVGPPLPSGDGAEGGRFFGWFEFVPE